MSVVTAPLINSSSSLNGLSDLEGLNDLNSSNNSKKPLPPWATSLIISLALSIVLTGVLWGIFYGIGQSKTKKTMQNLQGINQ